MTNVRYANNPEISNKKVVNNDIYYNYYLIKISGSIATIKLEKYGEEAIYIQLLIPPYSEVSDLNAYANQIVSLRIIFNGRWMGLKKFRELCQKYRWQVIDEAVA